MKKSILNVGKALNKAEQKSIVGGIPNNCQTDLDCQDYGICQHYTLHGQNRGICVWF